MKVVLTLVGVLATLGFAGQAGAVACVPSGNSVVNQYVDVLPGPGCNQAPGTGITAPGGGAGAPGNASGSGPAQTTLRPGAARALAAHGLAGQAVARLIATTAPAGAANSGRPRVTGASRRRGRVLLARIPSQGLFAAALSASTTAVTGGAGLGLVIFAAIALAAVLARVAWQRRRPGD